MDSGIYQIINKLNNKRYVGASKQVKRRFYEHKRSLLKNLHHSKLLQRAVNKYGMDNFEHSVLCTCPPEYLNKMESWFLKNLKPEYNIHISSEYTINRSKRCFSESHINNIKKSFTKERREKISKDVTERLTGVSKLEQSKLKIQLSVAKLTPEQVIIIRKRYEMGVKQVKLAKEFKVTKHAINKIVKRKTWKNI